MILKGLHGLLYRKSPKFLQFYLTIKSLSFAIQALVTTLLPIFAQIAILLFGMKSQTKNEEIGSQTKTTTN